MPRVRLLLTVALLAAQAREEEKFPLTVTFESLHCAECRLGIEEGLGALPGVKKVSLVEDQARATLLVLEKAWVSPGAVQKSVPSDLRIHSIEVTVRGLVFFGEEGGTLRAKDSGRPLRLANHLVEGEPEKDRVEELRRQFDPQQPKYRITGLLKETRKDTILELLSFERVEWKEEK